MKKIILSLLVAISIFNIGALAYDDVDSNDPYYYAIEHLRRHKVIVDGKWFQPDLIISKAEFIKYLVKINNPEFNSERVGNLPFKDTNNASWYASYFEEAIKLGILSADESNVYPFKKLNAIDALTLIFNSKSLPIPQKYVGEIPYNDVKNNVQSQGIIMRATSLGIIEPESEDYFGIYRKINRATAAQMIFQTEMLNSSSFESQPTQSTEYDVDLQKIINSWDLINSSYVDRDKIDQKELSTNAINALIKSIDDPYSLYLDQKANESFNDDIEGNFEGIGAYIAIGENGDITIVAPIKNSPAFKAGIKPGDIIRKVDNWDTKDAALQETVNRIKGPKGTNVTLGLEREGRMVEITVERNVINIKAVEYEVIENGKVMLAKLVTFNRNAAEEMKEMAEIVANSKDIKGVIIDLRGNPGGLLDSAIDIVSLFVPKGSTAVQIKYNYFNISQETTKDGILNDYPVVVLIDKGSASASEILAGALQELISATLVGQTSFGKGTVQEVNFFADNSSLKITVAKWLTPKGNSIQGNGITPDVKVEMGSAEENDRQLNQAIVEMNKKIK